MSLHIQDNPNVCPVFINLALTGRIFCYSCK